MLELISMLSGFQIVCLVVSFCLLIAAAYAYRKSRKDTPFNKLESPVHLYVEIVNSAGYTIIAIILLFSAIIVVLVAF